MDKRSCAQVSFGKTTNSIVVGHSAVTPPCLGWHETFVAAMSSFGMALLFESTSILICFVAHAGRLHRWGRGGVFHLCSFPAVAFGEGHDLGDSASPLRKLMSNPELVLASHIVHARGEYNFVCNAQTIVRGLCDILALIRYHILASTLLARWFFVLVVTYQSVASKVFKKPWDDFWKWCYWLWARWLMTLGPGSEPWPRPTKTISESCYCIFLDSILVIWWLQSHE